jgi:predicted permease
MAKRGWMVYQLRTLASRCAAMLRRGKLDRELDEELAEHLAMAAEVYERRGMTAEEARLAALREFGGVTQARETVRLREGLPFLENLRRDFGYALRQMKKSPGFAATVIGTLALGIGAAAAMFTVVDHVLLRPVPYRKAGRLVTIMEGDGKTGGWYSAPWLDIEQWRQQSRSFAEIAYSGGMFGGRNFLVNHGMALEVNAEAVSANLFPMLGVRPVLGRGFLPLKPSFGPDRNSGTILLSYAVWKQGLGGDRKILGKTVRINNKLWTVIGVMPPGFRYPAGAYYGTSQAWMPTELGKDDEARGNDANGYSMLARLRPGVTVQTAQAEMAVIQKRVAQEWPADLRELHSHVVVKSYKGTLVDADVRKGLLALLAAAGVLWLIASLNVTNLLLARGTARQREMAMRRALGASRWRIVRQMMVEGLALSAAAGALGIGLAAASVKLLGHEIRSNLPLPVPARPDAWILLALVGLTVASALLSTAWPALVTARAPLEPALKQGGLQTGQSRRHHRVRGALVALEIAMSLTLLMGCGLLLRTIYALEHVPLGFRTDHIVVAHLDIPAYRYTHRNLTAELYEPVLDRVQHLHGVESAGLMTEVPLAQTFNVEFRLYLKGRNVFAWIKAATPGVQQVFGFPMAAGRFFDAEDTATSQPVLVVNEAFAREYSPDKHNPAAILGTKLMGTEGDAKKADYAQVVGVLGDVHQTGVASPSSPEVEVCLTQTGPKSIFYNVLDEIAMDLAVRTQAPAAVVIPEIRDILRQADPELATANITTMDGIVEDSYGSQRLAAHLLEIFGGSALLLCIAGLYGLLAYVVNQRTRELGVRIALGAPRANVLWLVMRQAGAMLLAGVAVGSGLALASGRLARGFLYGVKAHDGWTLAAAGVVLFVCGILAAYLPARRAAGVDPMEALRAE